MKFAVALGLLAVAFAAQNWETRPELIRDQSFKTGKQYNFKFDGQIASGLPLSTSSQSSASRIESLLSLVFENDRTAVLKINKIRVGSTQKELVESREVQPFQLFEEIELSEEQEKNLLLPIRFRYENGLISEVEFDREEPVWSANIKRAVLNMLQMNLSKKARTDNTEMHRLNRDSEENDWEENTFYKTMEKTLEGECETSYTVIPSGEEKIRVSKSINFEKCPKRVDIRYNLRFGEECPSCESKFNREETNTQSSTTIEFELNGSPKEYLIREVRLRSQYLLTPLSGEEQMMGTFVSNKLTLLSVESETSIPRLPRSERKESIVYSTEWEELVEKFRLTGDLSLLKKSPYMWHEKKMALAEHLIESLRKSLPTEENMSELKTEMTHEFSRFIDLLRDLSTEELEKVEKMIEKKEKLMDLYFDALAQAGTYPTISRLVEAIKSRRLSTIQTLKALKMIMNVRYPSEKMINDLLRLSEESIVLENPMVKQSLWLSVGAVMNGVCGENRERFAMIYGEEKERRCPRELKEKYVREMETLLEKAKSHHEKVLALKVFANSGIDVIVFPLEKIITDKRQEKSIRLTAIESLRKLRNQLPRKVQTILLPIYKNTRESVELRVAAFHHLMHTLPTRSIIDQITIQLENEPSTRLVSYVYSTLKALANSELPCEKDLARDIEHSLRLVRRESVSLLDSRSVKTSYYSAEYLSGAALSWSQLFSDESVIPSEVSASFDTLLGGEWYSHLAEIGFSQENIHTLISKMYKYVKENKESIESVLVRGKRSSELRPVELLKEIMQKMEIKERRSESKDSAAIVYLRVKDMDYVFIPVEEKLIHEAIKMFIKNGASDLESIEKVLSRGYSISGVLGSIVYEKTRVIPTTIGMPLDITFKMPTVFSIDATIKASFEKRTLSVSAYPKIASTHVITHETRSPIVSTGVKIIHSAFVQTPVDVDFKLETENKNVLSLTFRVPQMEKKSERVMRLQSRPLTYIRRENEKKIDNVCIEKTIFLVNEPHHEISRVYGEEVLGLKFAVRGFTPRRMMEKIESRISPLFIGESDVEMRMEKTEETPREYSIRVSIDSIDRKTKMTEDIELDSFYPTEHSHFNVHSNEKKEKSRRSDLRKYLRTLSSSPIYSHRVHVTLETRGTSEKRQATGELRSLCDVSLSYCKFNLDLSRSRLEGEKREWELQSTLQTLLPSLLVSVDELKEKEHREILALLNTKWGSEEKKTVTLRAQMDQSEEMIEYVENQVEEKKMNSVELATRLNQIKISADYDLPRETLAEVSRISSYIKALYPFTYEVESRKENKSLPKEGTVLLKLTVEPQTWRYANFSMETPRELVTLPTMRLPIRPTWFSLEKRQSSLIHSVSPVCKVSSTRMTTFDEIVYRAPLTTCYSVLAKDCSEEPSFAVLLKKISMNGEEKKMKIITEENKIELLIKRGEIEVSVDGKIVKENKMEAYGLEKVGEYVIFQNEDIFVKFDGFKAEVKLNKMYKAKQCGLCGHFDGEKKGEFRMADDTETEDLEKFHRSFLLKNEECEIEEEKIQDKKNYKKYDYESESEEEREYEYETEKKEKNYDEEEETVEPVKRNQVVEYTHRLCFSKVPVAECPKKSHQKEEETKEVKVHFTCLERSSSEARRLLRESRTEILEIEDLPLSFVETVRVPKTCYVY